MVNYDDFVGKEIGNVKIIGYDTEKIKKFNRMYFNVECISCHKIKSVRCSDIIKGVGSTCFCQRIKYKHDEVHTRLFRIYWHIRDRCYNPNNDAYKNYGAKGVRMCQEWMDSFISFRGWAENNGYAQDLTIDRIDSNGNYCPENCQWITKSENVRRANLSRVGMKYNKRK